MSVANLDEWNALLQQQDPTQMLVLGNQILQRLTASQVQSLVSIFAGTENQRAKYVASGLLLTLLRNKDSRLSEDTLREVARAAERLARSEYPHTELGARAFAVLRHSGARAAEEFLLALPPTQLTGNQVLFYISDLELLNTAATVARLKELEQTGGELARRANQALANLGRLSDAQVNEIADQFRSAPSTALLNKIFHVYARFLIGKPLQPARNLLGKPTRQQSNRLIYQTDHPYAEMSISFNNVGTISDVSWR